VVEEVSIGVESVLLHNMEGNHAMVQLLNRHPVTLNPVLLTDSGHRGLTGQHAQWTVVEETSIKVMCVLLLNMEEFHARDQLLNSQLATLNPVQLMESGQVGLNGLTAQ